MHFAASIDLPADVETVAAMLATRDFADRRAAAVGAQEHSVQIDRAGEAFTVTADLTLPTTMVPASFRSFAPATVRVRLVEAWGPPAQDGSRTSTLTVDLRGVPVSVRGNQQLVPAEGGCVETYRGDVTASVPLVGKRIESAAAGAVQKIVDVDRQIGRDYLAQR